MMTLKKDWKKLVKGESKAASSSSSSSSSSSGAATTTGGKGLTSADLERAAPGSASFWNTYYPPRPNTWVSRYSAQYYATVYKIEISAQNIYIYFQVLGDNSNGALQDAQGRLGSQRQTEVTLVYDNADHARRGRLQYTTRGLKADAPLRWIFGSSGYGTAELGPYIPFKAAPPPPPPPSLATPLTPLCLSAELSDLTFVVGSERTPVPAHRLVLSAASPAFRKFISDSKAAAPASATASASAASDTKETKEAKTEGTATATATGATATAAGAQVIALPDVSLVNWQNFMRVVYGAPVTLDSSTASGLSALTARFGVSFADGLLSEYMGNVSESDATALFSSGTLYTTPGAVASNLPTIAVHAAAFFAHEDALKLAKADLITVLASDYLAVKEWDLFAFVQKWARARLSPLEADDTKALPLIQPILADVLPHIRFPLFTISQVSTASPLLTVLIGSGDLIALFAHASSGKAATTDTLGAGKFITRKRRAPASEQKTFVIEVAASTGSIAGTLQVSTSVDDETKLVIIAGKLRWLTGEYAGESLRVAGVGSEDELTFTEFKSESKIASSSTTNWVYTIMRNHIIPATESPSLDALTGETTGLYSEVSSTRDARGTFTITRPPAT